MPGPFTHIYIQRRIADFLAQGVDAGGVSDSFVRKADGELLGPQAIDPTMLDGLTPSECAQRMHAWPKFAALGAVGPDLFSFLHAYAQPTVPIDALALALTTLYLLSDAGQPSSP